MGRIKIIAGIVLLYVISEGQACPPPSCGPCYTGTYPNCVWRGCQPACTGCKSCNGSCSNCVDDQAKCTGCNKCQNGNCVSDNSKCNSANCETCVNGQCKVCDPAPLNCCNSSSCRHCVTGQCQPCLRKAASYAELQQCSHVVDDPSTSPSPNGCGPEGGPAVPDNPTGCDDTSFLDACNAHDICYGTCGNSKDSCDSVF